MNTFPTDTYSPTPEPAVRRAGTDLPQPLPGDPCRAAYELRFRSLFDEGHALAFPCDERGHVDLDALPTRALNNYYYARTVVGREFRMPAVVPAWPQ
jgi:hypothetical protein